MHTRDHTSTLVLHFGYTVNMQYTKYIFILCDLSVFWGYGGVRDLNRDIAHPKAERNRNVSHTSTHMHIHCDTSFSVGGGDMPFSTSTHYNMDSQNQQHTAATSIKIVSFASYRVAHAIFKSTLIVNRHSLRG